MSSVELPTSKEIQGLSRWARVAFAARCARRVLPMLRLYWPSIPEDHLVTLYRIVRNAENAAEMASSFGLSRQVNHAKQLVWDTQAAERPTWDARWFAEKAGPADGAAHVAFHVCNAIQYMAKTVDEHNAEQQSTQVEFAMCAASYAGFAAHASYLAARSGEMPRYDAPSFGFDSFWTYEAKTGPLVPVIRADFEKSRRGFGDDSPVPRETFGDLWPNGQPPWWSASPPSLNDLIRATLAGGPPANVQEPRGKIAPDEKQNRSDFPASGDFGIITMKEEEFRAVERLFKPLGLVSTGNRNYLLTKVPSRLGERTVLIARCLEQGQVAAQQCANDLIGDANPRWLLLVGIAGGFPSTDYTLGDVLLANRYHDFSVTATLPDGRVEVAEKGGRVHQKVEQLLTTLPSGTAKDCLGNWNGPAMIPMSKPRLEVPTDISAPAFYGSDDWKRKVKEGLEANFPPDQTPRDPLYRVESLVTGNTLVKDPALVLKWKEVARQSAHVEMELGGVYEAAHAKDKPLLSIRGLSDVVGFKRSSLWTEYACLTAAAFARALVASSLIDTR
jgi:nucleoside phosphorylase